MRSRERRRGPARKTWERESETRHWQILFGKGSRLSKARACSARLDVEAAGRATPFIGRAWVCVQYATYYGFLVFLSGRRFCSDDVVGLDPTGGADGEAGFCTRREIAGGPVVPAEGERPRRRH